MWRLFSTTIAVVIAIVLVQETNKFVAEPEFYGMSPTQRRLAENSKDIDATLKAMDEGWDARRKMCALPKEQQEYPYMCD